MESLHQIIELHWDGKSFVDAGLELFWVLGGNEHSFQDAQFLVIVQRYLFLFVIRLFIHIYIWFGCSSRWCGCRIVLGRRQILRTVSVIWRYSRSWCIVGCIGLSSRRTCRLQLQFWVIGCHFEAGRCFLLIFFFFVFVVCFVCFVLVMLWKDRILFDFSETENTYSCESCFINPLATGDLH